MAKKTKETEKSPATVAAKASAKIAEETLRLNPDMNEVHVTSDGTAFYTRNDAQNHANSLPNREVYSTNRRTAALKAAAAKSKADTTDPAAPGTPAAAPSDNEPEVDELTGEAVSDTDNEPANTDE